MPFAWYFQLPYYFHVSSTITLTCLSFPWFFHTSSMLLPRYCKRQKFREWKFQSLLGSSGMWGKISRFFPSPLSYIHGFRNGFPTLQNSYKRFNESFAFLTWILLKTVISILGYGQEYITDTCMCRFHTFQDDHAITGREELQLKWIWDETDR